MDINRYKICDLSKHVRFIIEIILLDESKLTTYHVNELKNIEINYPSIHRKYIKLNDTKSNFSDKQKLINYFISKNNNCTFEFFYYVEDVELCINTMIKLVENNSLTLLDAKCLEKILRYCSLTRYIDNFNENISSILKLINGSRILFIDIVVRESLYFQNSFFSCLISRYLNHNCKLMITAVDQSNDLLRKNLLKRDFRDKFLSHLERSYY